MTTLAAFYADVSAEIKRGTSLDARIPSWARRACELLEQDYSYAYMLTVERFDLESDEVILLPDRLKKIEYVRQVVVADDETESFRTILPAGGSEIVKTQAEIQYWWQEGGELRLDGVDVEDVTLEWAYYAYTDDAIWFGATTAEPGILSELYSAMLWQTLVNFAVAQSDNQRKPVFEQELAKALSARQRSDYARENPGPIRRGYSSMYGTG